MQNSSDRDDYIKILWDNVDKDYKDNFMKTYTTHFGLEYDYESIMHYSSRSFSKDNSPTIITKVNLIRNQLTLDNRGLIKHILSLSIESVLCR